MLVYLLNRSSLTRKFKKADHGYVYRRRPDLPGFLITQEEREDLLREFRRRYWKFWLLSMVCILASVALIVIVGVVFGFDEGAMSLVTYAFIVVLFGFILWEQRNWSLLPERHFANCPQIEPELPSAGWSNRFHNMMRNRSWTRHAAIVLINGTLAWLFSFDLPEATIGQWLLLIAFIASVLLSLYGAAHKARSLAGS